MTQEEFNKMLVKAFKDKELELNVNIDTEGDHGYVTSIDVEVALLDKNGNLIGCDRDNDIQWLDLKLL